jgi:uncharacterized lipoprotein YbaY
VAENGPASVEQIAVAGMVRRQAEDGSPEIRGMVRLEDVSEADAPARTLAATSLSMAPGMLEMPFQLDVRRDSVQRGSFSIAAEFTGAGIMLGTVQSYPWNLQDRSQALVIDLKRWR